ncbi:hypothetical protein I553_0058 [Mycobacterium xenopi 4042]|uniref:Uncharacterized protein n=1 Tax=Mycobacterium xenopi 4042 TaxID=1299334 RepID=X8DC46_MYCXE|nr:hypothetical protein I553_0058 [Mycobacterium xenopi 4042]
MRLLATGPGLALFASAVTRHGIDRARWSAILAASPTRPWFAGGGAPHRRP